VPCGRLAVDDPITRTKEACTMSKREERAAAAAKLAEEARRRERRTATIKVGSIVAAVVAIVVVCVFIGLNKGDGKVDNAAASSSEASSYSLNVGDKSAPHTIVIYEDFLCPYCDQLELASRDKLAQAAADGKVYLQYRPFRLLSPDYSGEALNAFAAVLKISGADVAKKYHDLLYENQPDESGPFPAVSSLVDLAVKAGADESAVKAAIEDTSSQKSWTDGATKAADAAGVQGTPTVLLDGKQFQEGSTLQDMAEKLVEAVS
jgi:protein-disulfide isomerase